MSRASQARQAETLSPTVLALREELAEGGLRRIGAFALGDRQVEVCQGRDSLWCLVRNGPTGGLALRAVWSGALPFQGREIAAEDGEVLRVALRSAAGEHVVSFATSGAGLHRLQVKVRFTPKSAMRLPYIPRDLYPLGSGDDPSQAIGEVHASQRGPNSGLVYCSLEEPGFGRVLYFQDFTALNRYFELTGTNPDGAVGGTWPELGYLPPTPETSGADQPGALPAGEQVVLSSAILVLREHGAENERENARQFLQMLATAYDALDLPPVEYRDWPGRAERTLRDLQSSRKARVHIGGNLYMRPYPEGETPDCMVQLSLIQSLHEYAVWTGGALPIVADLKRGLDRFYDPELGTLKRFLPGEAEKHGKDPHEVDSWYLYHPLLNLGRLALDGDSQARELLLKSVDYGIRAAHHFHYAWPIKYRAEDFAVIEEARGDGRHGQTDVGGIYAYVMLQCFQLTREPRFVDEACAAIEAARGLRFDLLYQANLSAWGAVACLRLWRILDDPGYLAQSYVYLAGLFHNAEIWESEIGAARHHSNFLGVTALHDSAYMAMYECFESYASLDEYLSQAGPGLDPAVRKLVSEYCKYALHRAWFYFPDALPNDVIHEGEHQSGVVDTALSFPLEDLYALGEAPGQVGQEIYGAGSAFVFAVRSHHRVAEAPFLLYCNQFIRTSERTGRRAIGLHLDGGDQCTAQLSLVRRPRCRLPQAWLTVSDHSRLDPVLVSNERIDFAVPANGRLVLQWAETGKSGEKR
jgi:hypothetical protein